MSKSLTGATTWAAGVTVPTGGDQRRASTVETPFQQLADRDGYLKNQVDVVGVNRIRYAETESAANAITGLTLGDFVVIGYHGLYRFTLAASAYNFRRVFPFETEVTSGGFLCLVGAVDADITPDSPLASAPVWTDATGRVRDLGVIPNRIIFDRFFAPDVDTNTKIDDLEGAVEWLGLSHSSAGQVNINISGAKYQDVLTFEMHGAATLVKASGGAAAAWAVFTGNINLTGTDVQIPGAITHISVLSAPETAGNSVGFSLLGYYTMPQDAGPYNVVLPLVSVNSATTTVQFKSGCTMRVTCRRP